MGDSWLNRMPGAREEAVGLAVVHGDPVRVQLGNAVGTARIERRALALRCLAAPCRTSRSWTPGRTACGCPARGSGSPRGAAGVPRASALAVYSGRLEGDLHVALGREVVDLGRLGFLDDADQVRRVRQVAEVQRELPAPQVRIDVEVVHAMGVEQRRTPLHAVHLVALAEQELGKEGAVLSGDAGDQGDLVTHHGASVVRRASAIEARDDVSQRLDPGCTPGSTRGRPAARRRPQGTSRSAGRMSAGSGTRLHLPADRGADPPQEGVQGDPLARAPRCRRSPASPRESSRTIALATSRTSVNSRIGSRVPAAYRAARRRAWPRAPAAPARARRTRPAGRDRSAGSTSR